MSPHDPFDIEADLPVGVCPAHAPLIGVVRQINDKYDSLARIVGHEGSEIPKVDAAGLVAICLSTKSSVDTLVDQHRSQTEVEIRASASRRELPMRTIKIVSATLGAVAIAISVGTTILSWLGHVSLH